MSASRSLVVTTIGTCRIADPIFAATKKRPLKRANRRVYGFVHTSKEALQQIECLLDGRQIPDDLAPFIAGPEKTARDVLDDPDMFIVEISTMKEIHCGEWLLQTNHMERALSGLRPLVEIFNKRRLEHEREARRAALEAHPFFAQTTPGQRRVLSEAYVRMTTRAELERDLAEINARLPAPALFSCHIDVDALDGARLGSRRQLCNWMREICTEAGYDFVDPTAQVVAFGRTRALAEAGRDVNHYAEKYKGVYGSYLFDEFCNRLAVKPKKMGIGTSLAAIGNGEGAADAQVLRLPVKDDLYIAKDHSPMDAKDFQSLIGRAKKSLARGQFDEVEALLVQNPGVLDTAEAHALFGAIAFHRVENEKAEEHLRAALQRDPDATDAKVVLVKVLQRIGRMADAVRLSNELLAQAPDNIKALIAAAKAITKAKQHADAVLAWKKVAALRPDEAGPLIEAARCELKLKNYADAVSMADAALTLEPVNTTALSVKAEALTKLRHMPELSAVLRILAPTDPALAMASVPALISSGHPEEAAAVIAAAQAAGFAGARDPALVSSLLRVLTEKTRNAQDSGHGAAAVAACRAIRLLDPDNKQAYLGLRAAVAPYLAEGRELADKGDFEGSVQAFRNGLALDEENARLIRELAAVLEKKVDYSAATDAWSKLSEMTEGGHEALLRAVRCALRGKEIAKALKMFRRLSDDERAEFADLIASSIRRLSKAMREDFDTGDYDAATEKANAIALVEPFNPVVERIRHKIVSATVKQMREAAEDQTAQMQLGQKILAINPTHVEALRTLAKLHSANRNHREAIAVYRQLTEIEPMEPRHWIKLAVACRGAKDYEAGVAAAMKAVEIEPGNLQAINILSGMLNRQPVAA
ncbi:tetratricopeptide repeat protein [Belnapia sp. T6]|uniref:Tetratricopeptide repeat protein n=1 Tax=Belnapia mucosa TaxID=2804532 RepID=A0ABS1VAV8_9PROT|nr:tetratricopeptide repeat protein [Belnapia mucosa]MBL6458805.1 tetratricopeptide repeat protein [Belnapia mucosa]